MILHEIQYCKHYRRFFIGLPSFNEGVLPGFLAGFKDISQDGTHLHPLIGFG